MSGEEEERVEEPSLSVWEISYKTWISRSLSSLLRIIKNENTEEQIPSWIEQHFQSLNTFPSSSSSSGKMAVLKNMINHAKAIELSDANRGAWTTVISLFRDILESFEKQYKANFDRTEDSVYAVKAMYIMYLTITFETSMLPESLFYKDFLRLYKSTRLFMQDSHDSRFLHNFFVLDDPIFSSPIIEVSPHASTPVSSSEGDVPSSPPTSPSTSSSSSTSSTTMPKPLLSEEGKIAEMLRPDEFTKKGRLMSILLNIMMELKNKFGDSDITVIVKISEWLCKFILYNDIWNGLFEIPENGEFLRYMKMVLFEKIDANVYNKNDPSGDTKPPQLETIRKEFFDCFPLIINIIRGETQAKQVLAEKLIASPIKREGVTALAAGLPRSDLVSISDVLSATVDNNNEVSAMDFISPVSWWISEAGATVPREKTEDLLSEIKKQYEEFAQILSDGDITIGSTPFFTEESLSEGVIKTSLSTIKWMKDFRETLTSAIRSLG